MMRLRLSVCLLLTGACSSSMPPAGPAHVPSESQEATTECPEQRKKAQRARESILGEDLSTPSGIQLRSSAAEKVLAHGECELAGALAIPRAQGTHDQILAGLRAQREQVHTAITLLREVSRYDEGQPALRAALAEARLKLAFADSVASVQPPPDLDVQSRMEFDSELSSSAQVLRREAAEVLEIALAAMAPEDPLRAEACKRFAATGQGKSGACP